MKWAQTSVRQVESVGAPPITADDTSLGRLAQAQPQLVEPEPEPEPEPEQEPEPEPELQPSVRSLKDKAKEFLSTNPQATCKPVSTGKDEEKWRHGEVLFEGAGTVTKFLIVPDHVKEPEEILRVMLDSWESEPMTVAPSHIGWTGSVITRACLCSAGA